MEYDAVTSIRAACFLTILALCQQLDKHQFTLNVTAFIQINHLDYIDQFIQMLGNLFNDFI